MSTMQFLTNSRSGNSGTGTTPLTIAQAIEVCSNLKNNTRNLVAVAPIVDLLAIVTHVETSKHRSNQRGSSVYVRIWIQDTTTSSSTEMNSKKSLAVQVLCFGRRRYTELMDHLEVRSGDIFRFNRIILMSSNSNESQSITFTYDIHNPEIGPEYYRFGNIFDDTLKNDDDSRWMFHPTSQLQQCVEHPLSMQTNPRCIIRLMEWYRQRHSQLATTTDQSEHGSMNRRFGLDSLPCQHRKLTEFQSCIGLVGHVTVNVLHIEQFTTAPFATKKRKGNARAVTVKYIFVTIKDDLTSSFMTQPATLVIDNESSTDIQYSNFQSILALAYSTSRPAILTNVTSIRNHPQYNSRRCTPPFLLSDSTDGIIIPTYKSNITLIENPIAAAEDQCELALQRPVLIPFVQAKNESTGRILEIIRIQSAILGIMAWTSNGEKFSFSFSNDLDDDDASIDLVLSLLLLPWMTGSCHKNCGYITRATIQLNMDDSTNQTMNVEGNFDTFSHLFGNRADDTIEVDGQQSKRIRPLTNTAVIVHGNLDHVNQEDIEHHKLMKHLFHSILKERVALHWSIEKVRYSNQPNATSMNENFFRVQDVWLSEF